MFAFGFSGVSGKFWLTVFTVLAVLAALSVLAVFELNYIRAGWAVLSSARREFSNLEKRRADISSASRSMEKLRPERELIRSSFADAEEPLPFIKSIESLGRKFGMKIELTLAGGRGDNGAQAYNVAAAGAFREVMSFLRSLESLPFWAEIGDVEIRVFEGAAEEAASKKSGPLVRLDIIIRPLAL